MVTKKATSTATTAYGRKLDTPLPYEYEWTVYESFDELQAAKDELTNDEQVKTRNTERLSNARQKALQKALDEAGIVKPTAENDEQIRLKDAVKTFLTAKLPDGTPRYDMAAARALAEQVIGAKFDDE